MTVPFEDQMYSNIKNISQVFLRYRLYYKLSDFILLFFIFYTVLYYFNAALMFSGYMEYYLVDAVSFDDVMVMGLSAMASIVLVVIYYMAKPPVNAVKMIESRYHWMRERLQTACDSIGKDNVVVADLISQVTSQLKQVDIGSFLDKRYLSTRVLMITVLVLTLVMLSVNQVQSDITPYDIERFIKEVSVPEELTPSEETDKNGLQDDIYGEVSVASIQGEQVELFIVPGLGTTVTIRHADQGNEVQFIPSQTYPVDIVSAAAADEKYQAIQQLSAEDREMIRAYAVLRSQGE